MSTSTLPTHPVTGALALGWRKARPGEDPDERFPIWPVLGGAPEDDEDGEGGQGDDSGESDDDHADDDDGGQDDDPEGADQLGDAGKKALARMKEKWRTERERRKAAEDRLSQNAANKDDGGQDADEVRRKAEREATARANQRLLKAEIRAAAAGKLADPRDAFKFLDLDQFEVDESGEVDADEIADAIDDLIKGKPYLAAQSRPRFQGTADGGAARKASRPKQLTRADLKSMTPEAIDRAREDGRLEDLMSGK